VTTKDFLGPCKWVEAEEWMTEQSGEGLVVTGYATDGITLMIDMDVPKKQKDDLPRNSLHQFSRPRLVTGN
jgi:hypothetical protein